MKQELVCIHCGDKLKKVFPDGSQYEGEHIRFKSGELKNPCICDHCGKPLPQKGQVLAFSIYTDDQINYDWEPQFLNNIADVPFLNSNEENFNG